VKLLINFLFNIGLGQVTSLYREQTKHLKILKNFTRKIVEKKREDLKTDSNHGNCLLVELLNAKNDFTDNQICNEMNESIFGTTDTTASAIPFILYCLAKHPEVQQKAREEVSQIFRNCKEEKEIKLSDLNLMFFIEAVIKESLRLFPSIPFFTRKLSSEVTAGGFTFPKDAEIMISPFLMGRNSKYFSNPLEFNPNRFYMCNTQPPGFIAFSVAPRKCKGAKQAFVIMKIAIAKIISSFEIKLSEEIKSLEMTPSLKSSNGINLQFLTVK
jgi:cytochrome P450